MIPNNNFSLGIFISHESGFKLNKVNQLKLRECLTFYLEKDLILKVLILVTSISHHE